MGERGLDDRERDESGRIRAKSGTAKMGNLSERYPEFDAFDPDATLSGIRARYAVESIDEVLALARRRRRNPDRRAATFAGCGPWREGLSA